MRLCSLRLYNIDQMIISALVILPRRTIIGFNGRLLIRDWNFSFDLPNHLVLDVAKVVYRQHSLVLLLLTCGFLLVLELRLLGESFHVK